MSSKIPREYDRRVKLSDEQRAAIKTLHQAGASIHELSRLFSVSRRLIQFLLFPERAEKNREDYRLRGGSSRYYDRERNTAYARRHRKHKREVMDGLEE